MVTHGSARILITAILICAFVVGNLADPIRQKSTQETDDPTRGTTHRAATDESSQHPPTDTGGENIPPPNQSKLPSIPPPPPVPPQRNPAPVNPPPPPPLSTVEEENQPEEPDGAEEEYEGTDEGLYSHGLLEGDIVPSPTGKERNAVSDPNLKWPVGAIVFKVDDSVGCPDSPQCEILMKAMNHFHKRACVRFKEWTGEEHSVNVFFNTDSSGACWSSVGRMNEAEQALSLGERCWYLGIVIHELAHAIGFWHEMNRPDRDDWIWVYWDNIIPGFQSAFDKNEPSTVNNLGENFDYKSIMMYDEYAFSKDGVSATLQAKDVNTVIGPIWKKKGLSESDIRRLHNLYVCRGSRPLTGFPYDIHCDFNYHQCGYKNGGSAVWNWRSVNATDGYVYASFEESGSNAGFLQSINFHQLEATSDQDESTVGVFGCLRFWYYIDSNAPATLMVWHAYLDRVTQLAYDPDKVFELWEDGNITRNWVHVDIPLYVSRPFKLIFVSNFDENAATGTIAMDDIELLYSPCLEEPVELPTKPPPAPLKPPNSSEPKPTSQPLPYYCPEDLRHSVRRYHPEL